MSLPRSLIACAVLAALSLPAAADERQDLETLRATTLQLIEALVEQGVLTREKADALVKRAEQKGREAAAKAGAAGPAAAAAEPGVVRVPYVPEVVKKQLREEIKQEVIAQAKEERWAEPRAFPSWADRIRLEGDLRLRYQGDLFSEGNAPPAFFQSQVLGPASGVDLTNTQDDRDRFRIRARLGILAQVNDWVGAGFRIATGNIDSPVSTTETLGDDFNSLTISLDRAYLKMDPVEWVTLWGGRMPNPWYSTDLVWDDDLNFDGFAVSFNPYYRPDAPFKPFFTVGAFPVEESELSTDKWLYAAQAGFDWQAGLRTRWKLGLAYYEFRDIEGRPQAPGSFGSPGYGASAYARGTRQKGNTLFEIADPLVPCTGGATNCLWGLASKFELWNLTAGVDLAHWDPVHVVLEGDYVRNVGFDADEIRGRTNGIVSLPGGTPYGYHAKITVGMPRVRDWQDWQVFLGYKYLQPDAVLDAFTDSDFHLGGTNAKGYYLGASYALQDNLWLTLRYLSANEVTGPPLAIDVLQLDLNARF